MKWQPIETAPKDERILVWAERTGWTGQARIVSAMWYNEAKRWYIYGCGGTKHSEQWLDECSPTHWMPLPAPPETKD